MVKFTRLAPCLAVLSVVACGGHSASPTAPGVASDRSTFNAVAAQLSGSIARSASSNSHAPRFVEGNAVVLSLVNGTSCPTLSFMVEDHQIDTDETTRYSSGTCEDIIPGRPLTIQGLLASDGSVAASHIVLKGNHPTFVEGETVIVAPVLGTCPTRSFIVDGHITVSTILATTYDGGTCENLIVGARVQVKGLLLPDDAVTATGIKFKHDEQE